MKRRLAELCEANRVPGAVLGLLQDGRREVHSYGICSTATNVAVTDDTLFQIGSMTKVWTATLVVQLVEEGLVLLDEPVRTYLPEFLLSDDATTDAVTVRQLLTHTSGIADLDFGLFGRGDDCVERFVGGLAGRPMLHEPGRYASYCNSGFVVLGRLIEVLRGATWDESLRERIIRPLGLEMTFTLPEEVLLHRAAVGHEIHANGDQTPATVWGIPRAAGPAGLICSTADDVLTFADSHLGDDTIARAMREPQTSVPMFPDGPRGLAWNRFEWGGEVVVGHDGGTIGQLSFLRVVPQRRFAFVLLTNAFGGAVVHDVLLREVLAERLEIDVPRVTAPSQPVAFDAERYAGEWLWQGLTVQLNRGEDDSLAATLVIPAEGDTPPPVIPPIAMIALGDHRFMVRVPPLGVDSVCVFFEPDGSGRFQMADLRGRLMTRC